MAGRHLPSIEYEPANQPSLFDRWAVGAAAAIEPPLAVRDARYRSVVVAALAPYLTLGRRLVSVGAGNGYVESELVAAGWDVLATDVAEGALVQCRAKGLKTARHDLLSADGLGAFDGIYCDGVMGHLWEPLLGTSAAWTALAGLGRVGSIGLVSNDLSDTTAAQFAVRSTPTAAFYRPPAGCFVHDAVATGRWQHQADLKYDHERSGSPRQRELLVVRLLVDEGVEPEDRA